MCKTHFDLILEHRIYMNVPAFTGAVGLCFFFFMWQGLARNAEYNDSELVRSVFKLRQDAF